MIIVYTPADGEPEHYDARLLLASEASIVARVIDQKWPQVKEGLVDEDLDAMRGVAWVLKKRHNSTLAFSEFDPGVDELVTRFDKREIENWVRNAFSVRLGNPDATVEQVLLALHEVPGAALDRAHAEAFIKEMAAESEGKAPAKDTPPAVSPPGRKSSARSTSATSARSTSSSSATS